MDTELPLTLAHVLIKVTQQHSVSRAGLSWRTVHT